MAPSHPILTEGQLGGLRFAHPPFGGGVSTSVSIALPVYRRLPDRNPTLSAAS